MTNEAVSVPRQYKLEVPFTQIANSVLNDKRLSLKAKGLFSYLYSKPDGWDFSSKRIALQSTDGEASVLSGLKELEECGYLVRVKQSDGRMDYQLNFTVEPNRENPKQGKSQTGKTAPISNKDILVIKNISNKDIATRQKPLEGQQKQKQKHDPLGAEIIKAFEAVDPKNKTYYNNTTQRKACDFLIEQHGLQAVLEVIMILPLTNQRPRYEFPHISTPHQLMNNWSRFTDEVKRHKKEQEEEQSNIV